MGLLSGVHCVGMCGGIVSALSLGTQAAPGKKLWIQLFYNLGRISSYTLAGLLVGWIGAVTTQAAATHTLHQILNTFSGVILVLMGLYLANWWRVLIRLEQAGALIWKKIEPYARKLIPIKTTKHAFLVGMLWGWLPCGLVYSMLTLSLTSASASQGALVMLSFGLGTLPNLLAMGLMAASLQTFLRQPLVKMVAGLLIIAAGVYLIAIAWMPMDAGDTQQHLDNGATQQKQKTPMKCGLGRCGAGM
ncbi:MAG: sulfite exporter TauE/SafE family protein [Thioalkalispiraceae bacterium]